MSRDGKRLWPSWPSPDSIRGSVPAIRTGNAQRLSDRDHRPKAGDDALGQTHSLSFPAGDGESHRRGRESTHTLSAMDPLPGPSDRRG